MKNHWFTHSGAFICWLYKEMLRLKKLDGERRSASRRIGAFSGADSQGGPGS